MARVTGLVKRIEIDSAAIERGHKRHRALHLGLTAICEVQGTAHADLQCGPS